MNAKYVVALSFSGTDRIFAEAVASELKDNGITVFYDKYEQHELWGKDLFSTLRNVYVADCRYVVMVISQSYLERMWPQFERQQIIEKLATNHGSDAVLPVRLDKFDQDVPGLSRGIGYLSVQSNEATVVADALLRKIGNQKDGIGPGQAFEKALQSLRQLKRGALFYDFLYTSKEAIAVDFPQLVGSEVLDWLGNEFVWKRPAGQPLSLFGRNLSLSETKDLGLVEICRFDAPTEWVGCGRWKIYWFPQENETTEPSTDQEKDNDLLIALYLYSQNTEDMNVLLDSEELETAFLSALLLKRENATRFYDSAERNFHTLR